MPDYGHDLHLGAFLTPQSRRPQEVVALAQLSEQSGLDLVTFQDHPYQPAFLDTWTLLSLGRGAHRAHPPRAERPEPAAAPAGRARARRREPRPALRRALRASASAPAGSGTRSRRWAVRASRPAQAVDALEEAIDVIRELWDVGERARRPRRRRVLPRRRREARAGAGARHPDLDRRVQAAHAAPDSAARPTGGCPSLAYIEPRRSARAGNATIDEAAVGRRPRPARDPATAEHRRSSAADSVRRLGRAARCRFVLEHGIGTFILGGDDPRTIRTFGEEVAPALREAVARERRSAGTPTGPVRGRAALAKRRAGIDYDAVPAGARGASSRVTRAYVEGALDLPARRARRGSSCDRGRPRRSPRRSRSRVGTGRAARRPQRRPRHQRPLDERRRHRHRRRRARQRSRCSTPDRRLVRIGPGARWGEVAARPRSRTGWALSSGDYGGVGVGGLATAGGIGCLAREHGLTIDHVRAVEVVLADGRIVRADADDRARPALGRPRRRRELRASSPPSSSRSTRSATSC